MKLDFKKLAKLASAGNWQAASQFLTKNTLPLRIQISAEILNTPHTGVVWRALSPQVSHFTFNADLPKDRVQFFMTRLALTMPIITAFHHSNLFTIGSVFINLDDSADAQGIAFCSNRNDQLLIPDAEFLETKGYSAARSHFGNNPLPWKDRTAIAFWRGSTTGVRSGNSWRDIPRVRMCEICNAEAVRPIFDVGLSGLAQIPDCELNEIRHSGLIRDYFPILSSNRYKYQIDIDGNTNAWAGLFQKLLSGSAVLKVKSPHDFQQWYYHKLIPWEHYVPVKSDMSDLVEKTRWLIENDYKAKAIGESGANLARSLSYESVMETALNSIQRELLRSGRACLPYLD